MTAGDDVADGRVAAGDRLASLVLAETTLTQMVRWAAAADDYSPIHFDAHAAAARGLPAAVVTGPWKAALLTRMVTEWLGARGSLRRIECRYRRLDLVGGGLRCDATVTAVRHQAGQALVELELQVCDQQGQTTLSGAATVTLHEPVTCPV